MTGAYEEAGVSLARGDFASQEARQQVAATYNDYVSVTKGVAEIDLLRAIPAWIKNPQLASAMDGVGTKLIYAAAARRVDTVGRDLVAMVVDDLVRYNIFPLTFGMYRGFNQIDVGVARLVLQGAVDGCVQAGLVPYTSGETAEMPGFYSGSNFELVGFSVGVHEKGELRDGSATQPGDLLIGLPSYGGGSNGFTLFRQIWPPEDVVAGKCPVTIEEILVPTPIYAKPVLITNQEYPSIRGWAHITGGGLGCRGKLPSLLPEGLSAELDTTSWTVPAIFNKVRDAGSLSLEDWRETFNLGLMMVAPITPSEATSAIRLLESLGCEPAIVGRVIEHSGENRVQFS
jgi:phosphoribosylformylglycinamidine cyclo-ligase